MINIRQGLFETNSSSTHSFCIPGHKSLKIPKEIRMSQLNRYVDPCHLDTIEDRIAYMYCEAEDNNYRADFIDYLKHKGIEIIDDRTDPYDFPGYMFNYDFNESELDNFLFNPDSKFILDGSYDELNRLEKEGYSIIDVRV